MQIYWEMENATVHLATMWCLMMSGEPTEVIFGRRLLNAIGFSLCIISYLASARILLGL